ncbi:MAG: ABC transporter ATP-binding protein, partial [Moorea sp. SIO3E2]|nr:ABC transporter ATP-binding protein [Moorena sp. SIO3E2]
MSPEIAATKHRYRRMLLYPLRQWRTFVVILALTAATSFVTTLQPWPMKILVDYALGDTAVPAVVGSLLGNWNLTVTPFVLVVTAALASLGLYALNAILEVGLIWFWSAAGQRMVYDLAQKLFHRLQRLSLLFHSQRSVGDSLSRLTVDTYCVYTLTNALL